MKYALILFLFLILGCKKQDNTESVDITAYKWKMQSIKVNGIKTKIKDDEYFNKEAYVLIFLSDSVFQLNTSVNHVSRKYSIYNTGKIFISSDYETTLVGSDDSRFDDKLLENLPLVSSYQILEGNILIFKGERCEMVFKQI